MVSGGGGGGVRLLGVGGCAQSGAVELSRPVGPLVCKAGKQRALAGCLACCAALLGQQKGRLNRAAHRGWLPSCRRTAGQSSAPLGFLVVPHVVMGPRTQSVRFGVMPWVQFWAVNGTAAAPWFQPVVPETAVQSLQALAKKAGCLLVAVHALGSLVGNLPLYLLGRPVWAAVRVHTAPLCGIPSSVHRRPCTVRSHRKTGEATGLEPSLAPTKRGLTP